MSPVEVWVSSGLLQGQELWVQQTWVWYKPFWKEVTINHTTELPELTMYWGNRFLEGSNLTLFTGLRRKEL